MPREHPLSLVYIYPKMPRLSITNVEKSRQICRVSQKTPGIDINPWQDFRYTHCVRYVLRTRYTLRGEKDLYHIEAKLYRMGIAHISILRSKISTKCPILGRSPSIGHLSIQYLPYSPKIRLLASGKYSVAKSTPPTMKDFPFSPSRPPASVVKVKVSL